MNVLTTLRNTSSDSATRNKIGTVPILLKNVDLDATLKTSILFNTSKRTWT